MRDAASEGTGNPVPTPYDVQAHATRRQRVALGVQVPLQQKHQVVDFAPRTPPVVGGESVERKRGDPEGRRGLDRSSNRCRSGDMARLPGLTAKESPAAVPIHIDRDMESVPASAFRLLGVPPSRIQATSCHRLLRPYRHHRLDRGRAAGAFAISSRSTLHYKELCVNHRAVRNQLS